MESGRRAPDGNEIAAAAAAGWTALDLAWEAKMEEAGTCFASGDRDAAAALWRESLGLARRDFETTDPRLGTSLANAALAARQAGDGTSAQSLFAEARRIWDASSFWVDALAPERRARSSLFHLRMEARHRETYDAQFRNRLHRFGEEARESLRALEAGEPSPHRGLARWRAEKPARYGDSRKFLAACLLLAVLEK